MIGKSSNGHHRIIQQSKGGRGTGRNSPPRPPAFTRIWRDCFNDEAYYEFADGSIWWYGSPAAEEARQVANAQIHGLQFDLQIRRDGFSALEFERLTSEPSGVELIYSYPPYDNDIVEACPTFCTAHHPTQPIDFALANWILDTPIGTGLSWTTTNATNLAVAVFGPVYPSGIDIEGHTQNLCVNKAVNFEIIWKVTQSFWTLGYIPNQLFLDGRQIVVADGITDPIYGSKNFKKTTGSHRFDFAANLPSYPAGVDWQIEYKINATLID